MKKYKILGRTPSAVLLESSNKIYKILDIENEVIYLGADKEKAEKILNEYDINKAREAKEYLFELWLKENAKA